MVAIDVRRRPAEVGRRFYLGYSVLMVAVLLAGFAQTVPGDFHPPGIPFLLHLHGAVFTLWPILAIAQPALVTTGDLKRHRQLGYVGAGLAATMVVMAFTATVVAIRQHVVPPSFPPAIFLAMNGLDALCFGGLVAAAVVLRKNAQWHKRLMICATGAILAPGLGRALPMDAMGPIAPLVMFGVNDLILLIGPAADLAIRRRVHPAYAWGIGALLLTEVLIGPVALSPLGQALLKLVQG